MNKTYTLFIILIMSISNAFAQKEPVNYSVLFDYNKSELTPINQTILDEILLLKNIKKIQLTGHTDSDGNQEYNLQLSQKRVTTVQNYLINQGIVSEQITTNYHGENIPVSNNETESGKQQNRRVEITVYFQVKQKRQPPKIVIKTPEIIEIDTPETVVEVLEDTTLFMRGLRITMTKKDFNAYDGTLEIEPILTVDDALANGLTTMTTRGDLLVSDGMIAINPLPDGGCLRKPIKIYFPVEPCSLPGRRNNYIQVGSQWRLANGNVRRIKKVKIDGIEYFEMLIKCPLYPKNNADLKVYSYDVKVKVPRKYKLQSITYTNEAPLAIYKYSRSNPSSKLLVDFPRSLPCTTPNIYVILKNKKGKIIELPPVTFDDFRHGINKHSNYSALKYRIRVIFDENNKKYKKYKITRRLIRKKVENVDKNLIYN